MILEFRNESIFLFHNLRCIVICVLISETINLRKQRSDEFFFTSSLLPLVVKSKFIECDFGIERFVPVKETQKG